MRLYIAGIVTGFVGTLFVALCSALRDESGLWNQGVTSPSERKEASHG